MKKIFLIVSTAFTLFAASGFIIFSNGIAGQTGSPGEGTCASCHSGGAGTTSVTINSVPAFTNNEYIPGQTYTISIGVANSNFTQFGFGAEILNSTNANAGSMQNAGSGVTFANSGAKNNAIQTAPKTGTGAASFTFEWTAPSSGNATIYAAGNAVNGNNGTSGDRGGNTSLALTALSTGVTENTLTSNISLFPNPVNEEINVSLFLSNESDITISIFDLNGKELSVLSNEKYTAGSHNLNYKIDQELTAGIYIVKVRLNNEIKTQKLFIKK